MLSLVQDADLVDASVGSRRPPRNTPQYSAASTVDIVYPPPRPSGKARLMVVTVVVGPSRRFMLKGAFVIRLEHTSSGVIATHAKLPVSGHGDTPVAALEEFCEMFELQWESLVDCSPSELTEDAMRTREDFVAIAELIQD